MSTLGNCDQCSAKFNFLRRKNLCYACQLQHCSDCLTRITFRQSNSTESPNNITVVSEDVPNSFLNTIQTFIGELNGELGLENVYRICRKCKVFYEWPVDIGHISKLRVKDLKFYLSQHCINGDLCTEKDELTALVANQIRKFRVNPNGRSRSQQSRSQPDLSSSNVSANRSSVIHDDGIRVQPVPSEAPEGNRSAADSTFNNEESHSNSSSESFVIVEPSNDAPLPSSSPLVEPPPPTSSVDPPSSSSPQPRTTPPSHITSQAEMSALRLEDLADEAAIRALSVRQCRVLLAKHRVTVTHIIEKEQLVQRLLLLWRSHQSLDGPGVDALPDALLCKICMEAPVNCVLLECGHMLSCTDCGRQLSECPVCRETVCRVVHTFLA